jgi:hypothetical protein
MPKKLTDKQLALLGKKLLKQALGLVSNSELEREKIRYFEINLSRALLNYILYQVRCRSDISLRNSKNAFADYCSKNSISDIIDRIYKRLNDSVIPTHHLRELTAEGGIIEMLVDIIRLAHNLPARHFLGLYGSHEAKVIEDLVKKVSVHKGLLNTVEYQIIALERPRLIRSHASFGLHTGKENTLNRAVISALKLNSDNIENNKYLRGMMPRLRRSSIINSLLSVLSSERVVNDYRAFPAGEADRVAVARADAESSSYPYSFAVDETRKVVSSAAVGCRAPKLKLG